MPGCALARRDAAAAPHRRRRPAADDGARGRGTVVIDLRLLREQPDLFRASMTKRGLDPGIVDQVLALDRARREHLHRVEELRAAQKRASEEIPRLTGAARSARIEEMKQLAAEIKAEEPALAEAETALNAALAQIPNPPHPSVPRAAPITARSSARWGTIPAFPFAPRDHVDLGTRLGLLDMERGAKVSGSRFFFLRGDGALLELALIRYAVDRLLAEGFSPTITPVLVRQEHLLSMMGGAQLDDQMVYRVEGEDLALTGTSEMALGAMYAGEMLDDVRAADPPLRDLDVLPPGSRGARQGHARDLPGAPVRQGRDVLVLPPRPVVGGARVSARRGGAAVADARPAVPRRQHRRRRPRRPRGAQVRHRDVDAGPRRTTARRSRAATAPTSSPARSTSGSGGASGGRSSCTR